MNQANKIVEPITQVAVIVDSNNSNNSNNSSNLNELMSYTFGGAATDRIVTNYSTYDNQRTFWFVYNRTGNTASGAGRIFDKTTAPSDDQFFWNNGLTAFSFQTNYTTRRGAFDFWQPQVVATNSWNCICFSFDKAAAATPIAYNNGTVLSGIIVRDAPSGTPLNTTQAYIIGNRAGADRVFQGQIGGFAIWNTLLPASAMEYLSNFRSPLLYPKSLIMYLPMISNVRDLKGSTTTLTSAVVASHPKLVMPL